MFDFNKVIQYRSLRRLRQSWNIQKILRTFIEKFDYRVFYYGILLSIWYLLVQSHSLKYLNNVWNLSKVNNKDNRTTSMASFWWLYCQLWTYLTYRSGYSILNTEKMLVGYKIPVGNEWTKTISLFPNL